MAPIVTVPVPPFFEPGAPPRLIPHLIVETDIDDISPDMVPLLLQDIDMAKPLRRTVRVATPPPRRRSVSVGPARSRASSVAPVENNLGSDDDSSALSSVTDEDDSGSDDEQQPAGEDVVKIPKPAGEVGRPNRGGYKLEDALQWNTARMRVFKSLIHQLVDEHLDPTLSMAGQSERRMRLVRDEAIKRLPDLAMYDQEWPLIDAVKQRLKYTSSKARQHAHEAVSLTAQKKARMQRR
ncbi:uncharacterized protein TRAVEDRAFT_20395 [Trametes versicolor FP-101664 SS1]|uniref:uncharacterized protein n=1 Tax=Trametes versicolor (strain FP-101664) TaxID=717944 RepID=UPI00046244F4|nr:uncharacterized protein TRAVEDRAFT_20395 [Trametes versicolor FP-101664 SS1]EIW58369.1 hypothetical protein TRAVEDRAFT_20395 [Trametes versicolor FP-101664 SS1]